jgi:predicted DNA-binding protein (MmcQ/YjbR family)
MAGMTRDELRTLCLSLPEATEDFPFGEDTAVLRVGAKIFAILPVNGASINLKAEPEQAIDQRKRYQGIAPGWHQNKRHWNTVTLGSDVPDEVLTALVEDSYDLVFASLPKRERDAIDVRQAARR